MLAVKPETKIALVTMVVISSTKVVPRRLRRGSEMLDRDRFIRTAFRFMGADRIVKEAVLSKNQRVS